MDPKHYVDIDSVRVLTTEEKWLEKGNKEAIYIRALRPSLNSDEGRYDLPAITTQSDKEFACDGEGGGGGEELKKKKTPLQNTMEW